MAKNEIHPKLSTFIETMLCDIKLKYEFYGEFCNYINFLKATPTECPTMGVNVGKEGMKWWTNFEFLDNIEDQKQVNWGGLHEILHLIFDHPKRTKQHHNHYLANIAQDAIINHILDNDFDPKFCTRIPGTIVLPKEYEKLIAAGEAKLYFEDVYEYYYNKEDEYKDEKNKHGGGKGGQQDGEGKDNRPDENGKYKDGHQSKIEKSLRDIFDRYSDDPSQQFTFDNHMNNEIDDDMAKEIVNQIKEGLKSRGLAKGNVESVLGKLQRKRKDYLKEIKRAVNVLKGSVKYKTINRPNIIGLDGLKGKKTTGHGLNVILDTSGSMGSEFEKVLSYIFQRNILINLIQCDTEVQSVTTLDNMKDFKKIKIKGLGGTVIQPAVNFIKENPKKLGGFNTLILTDGYTDSLNFNGMKGCRKVLVISTHNKVPIDSSNTVPVKQIVIDRDC